MVKVVFAEQVAWIDAVEIVFELLLDHRVWHRDMKSLAETGVRPIEIELMVQDNPIEVFRTYLENGDIEKIVEAEQQQIAA